MLFHQEKNKKLRKMHVMDIRRMGEVVDLHNWYFNACVLTFPETMIVQSQIRQALFVFEHQRPHEVLVVVLCEAAVRKYCNLLKPFTKFQFVNGAVKSSHLHNIFVLITDHSKIIQIQSQHQEKSSTSLGTCRIFPIKTNIGIKDSREEERKYAASLNIPNQDEAEESDDSSCINAHHSKRIASKAKSEVIQCRQQNNEELVNLRGTVVSAYEVGKGRANHGVGYRIEQCLSRARYEVVVWCDMEWNNLKSGKTYQFINFRPHRKHNLDVSFHSHAQYSSIRLLD